MKRMTTGIFVLILTLAGGRPALAQTATDEQEVRAVVTAFGKAFREADVSALEGMLTENYLHVNGRSGSVLGREVWLNWIASRRIELDEKVLVIDSYRVEDVKIQIYGDVAVVTGIAQSSGLRNETSFSTAIRFTNVWVRQDGAWRRAAFHDSPIPTP